MPHPRNRRRSAEDIVQSGVNAIQEEGVNTQTTVKFPRRRSQSGPRGRTPGGPQSGVQAPRPRRTSQSGGRTGRTALANQAGGSVIPTGRSRPGGGSAITPTDQLEESENPLVRQFADQIRAIRQDRNQDGGSGQEDGRPRPPASQNIQRGLQQGRQDLDEQRADLRESRFLRAGVPVPQGGVQSGPRGGGQVGPPRRLTPGLTQPGDVPGPVSEPFARRSSSPREEEARSDRVTDFFEGLPTSELEERASGQGRAAVLASQVLRQREEAEQESARDLTRDIAALKSGADLELMRESRDRVNQIQTQMARIQQDDSLTDEQKQQQLLVLQSQLQRAQQDARLATESIIGSMEGPARDGQEGRRDQEAPDERSDEVPEKTPAEGVVGTGGGTPTQPHARPMTGDRINEVFGSVLGPLNRAAQAEAAPGTKGLAFDIVQNEGGDGFTLTTNLPGGILGSNEFSYQLLEDPETDQLILREDAPGLDSNITITGPQNIAKTFGNLARRANEQTPFGQPIDPERIEQLILEHLRSLQAQGQGGE